MISTIAQELIANRSFLIATHVNPDGDAIGSLGALALVLEGEGKDVTAYCQDRVPEFLHFLSYSNRIIHELPSPDRFDTAVILDCGDWERLGSGAELLNRTGKIIHIDHHDSSSGLGHLNLIEPRRSSTAELLYEIFQAMSVSLSLEAAENIYTGILTDTGSFRFANTTARALGIAAEMVSLGVMPDKVASEVYDSMSPERLRLLAMSIDTLALRAQGRVAATWVSQQMLAATGATVEDTDGFVNYPRSIRSVEMAIFFKEIAPGLVNVSLRSRGGRNVADFARSFHGGGHHNAAAFRRRGSVPEIVDSVLEAAERFIVGEGT